MMMLGLDGLDVRRMCKLPPGAMMRAGGYLLYHRENTPERSKQTNDYLSGADRLSVGVKA